MYCIALVFAAWHSGPSSSTESVLICGKYDQPERDAGHSAAEESGGESQVLFLDRGLAAQVVDADQAPLAGVVGQEEDAAAGDLPQGRGAQTTKQLQESILTYDELDQ